MQRLHDKVTGNWQKFTTVTNKINQEISKREQEIKKFLNLR